MLNRLIIALLVFVTSPLIGQELCLYDENTDGVFQGSPEIRECEPWSTLGGFEVNSCPIGRVPCDIVGGVPVCPTNASFPCTQPDPDTPLSCSGVPLPTPPPPECRIEFDEFDEPYLICNDNDGRDVCERPEIPDCLPCDPDGTCPEQPDPCIPLPPPPCPIPCSIAGCADPDSCDVPCYVDCLEPCVDLGWDPLSGELPPPDCNPDPLAEPCPTIEPCEVEVIPDCLPCDPDGTCPEQPDPCIPLPLPYACPTNPDAPCTNTGEDFRCSAGGEVIPPNVVMEFDQDENPHVVYDGRRATCQLFEGKYQCPFNSSSAACTAPEGSTDYKCAVEEVTCKPSSGNVTSDPLPIEPFPSEPSANEMPDGEECTGEIRIFHGEPFSCNLAGIRSRWENCCNDGNNIIEDAMDNYFDGVVNMVEAVTDMNGTEFLVDIITLYFWGYPAYHLTEALVSLTNWLLTPCADDSITAAMIANGRCTTVGVKCVESLFGTCLQEKQVECCFASKLSRIIQEQGRPQLGISWGTPDEPNCAGLTPEQFQSIDFSQIDLSEYIADMEVRSQEDINTDINNAITDDLLDITGGSK